MTGFSCLSWPSKWLIFRCTLSIYTRYVGAKIGNKWKLNITNCSKDLGLTGRDFIDIINNQYTNPENLKTPSYMVLVQGIIEIRNIKK